MKRKFTIFIILIFVSMSSIAQIESKVSIDDKYEIDDDVTYKGGDEKLMELIEKNLTYPDKALKDSISGTVVVYFTIDTNGHSTDIQVKKGIREDLNNEAKRCVDLLDEWNIGRLNGRKVKQHFSLPIKFSFQNLQ